MSLPGPSVRWSKEEKRKTESDSEGEMTEEKETIVIESDEGKKGDEADEKSKP